MNGSAALRDLDVLCAVTSPEFGGCEAYAARVATAVKSLGADTRMAVPMIAELDRLREVLAEHGVPVVAAPIVDITDPFNRRILVSAARVARCAAFLRAADPDVVHVALSSPSWSFELIVACALLRIPTVAVFQLLPAVITMPRWRRAIFRWMGRRGVSWVTVSARDQGIVARDLNIDRDRVALIRNGCAVEATRMRAREGRSRRADYLRAIGIPDTSRIILTVAALRSQKGHQHLVEAIPLLPNADDVHFVWLGEGEERAALARQIEATGIAHRVHLLSDRTDVAEWLGLADLFAFPTLYEGLPFSVIEAMAVGIPIVATDAPGISELLTHGCDAVICRAGDSSALAASLAWALEHADEMAAYGTRAQARAAAFDERYMLESTVASLAAAAAAAAARTRAT